ncbi:MAG TPA: FAD-dependent oxidoreductase [Allosphingosinicella sp.]
MSLRRLAIIGGGFSGTLAAIQLLRRGHQVTLIERAERVGRGVAYSTPHADHLLNVRASGMSAFPEEPDHFSNWHGEASDFAERRRYGDYLRQLLAAASEEAGDRLSVVSGEAVDVVASDGREAVLLEGGDRIEADAVVLSVGNLAPSVPRTIAPELAGGRVYVSDPWAGDFTAGLAEDDVVLLIGTGLTAIDAALMIESSGFQGRTIAISRRGMVPRAHAEPAPPPKLEEVPEPRCTSLVRSVRSQAARIGWRVAVDQLRPVTQRLWASASPEERRRFLRHLRPYWDVHRHRIAPSIAERIRNMVGDGRLQFAAGKILATRAEGDHVSVEWRPRGTESARTLRVARIVNCTGPEADISRADEPLLRNLVTSGRIRPDVCRIGIDIDEDGHVIGADGTASKSIYAIGPMTRGAWWEIVAVPDIRGQAEALARTIA